MKLRLHALWIGVTILVMSLSLACFADTIYTVRKGDTLWNIAKKHGVSIDELKRKNGVSANKPLPIGIKLSIPKKDEPQTNEEKKEPELTREQQQVIRFGPRIAKQLDEQKDDSENKSDIVRTALAYRGARYVRGGTGARGFDCSGFTRHVYKKYGVNLPHSSRSQAGCGVAISKSELKAGDLVFFATGRRGISHVGMYIGNGKFIHASTPRRGVTISSLDQKYYASRYICARRVIPNQQK